MGRALAMVEFLGIALARWTDAAGRYNLLLYRNVHTQTPK